MEVSGSKIRGNPKNHFHGSAIAVILGHNFGLDRSKYSVWSLIELVCLMKLREGKPNMMMSGLSGNEIYCLAQKGWTPGNIVVGNSVYSLGFLGSITSGLRMMAGGEIENVTRLISDGRHAAIQR
jgi:hypothetical protein